jgi:DNA-binding transcriptional LysR family regulator
MEIRKLEAFCKVIELKSFTRAAEAILLSQPTVSEHIRSLEQELDHKLVDRMGREIEATPVGRLLYSYAVKILQTRKEAFQAVEQYSGNMIGRILLGCGTIPGTYILPELIGHFRTQHPLVKSTLRINSSHLVAKQVLAGELELGVIGAKWNESGLEWVKVFSDELTLIVPPDHRLALRKSVSLDELVNEPFVFREPESGTRKVIAQILEEHGLRESMLQEVAEIGSTVAVKESVRAGTGVSIVSRRAVRDDLECGRLATVQIEGFNLTRPFYLIRRRNRELSPVTGRFYNFLLESSEKQLRT